MFGRECMRTGFQCSVNSNYPCKVLKHRCKVEDQKVVHKRSSIILVEQALLGTFEGTRDQLVPGRVLSASPSGPPAMLRPRTGIRHLLQTKRREESLLGNNNV